MFKIFGNHTNNVSKTIKKTLHSYTSLLCIRQKKNKKKLWKAFYIQIDSIHKTVGNNSKVCIQ